MLGSWVSSPEAEEAGHPIADHVSPTADLVFRIFAWETFRIIALISIKRISVSESGNFVGENFFGCKFFG